MKKNVKFKKSIPYIVAFFAPVLLFGICLFVRLKNIYGDLTVFLGDMTAQYVPLFSYLKNVFDGKESLFYSFSNGIGGGMIGTILYYLTSPLNFLFGFVSQESFHILIILIFLFKVGLSGLFMYIFLSNVLKKNGTSLIIFSTCYALSAYMVNYYFCLMWLDCFYLLPIIMLGIHKICNDKSPILYIVSLTVAIISNYYIGYMICIFCCIYFIYEMLIKKVNKRELFKYIKKFLIASILSGFMTFILLIPMFVSLMDTPRAFGNYEGKYTIESVKNNFDYLLLFKNFLLGTRSARSINIIGIDYYNIFIYCGLIILPLIYFYFVNKEISKKEKIFFISMILFFLASYSIKYISYIWHGFAFPNGLNYRFSFIFIFLFIFMAAKSFYNVKQIDKKYYYYFAIVFVVLLNILVINDSSVQMSTIYINLIIMLFCLVLLYLYNSTRIDSKNKNDLRILLPLLILGELFYNCYTSLDSYFGISIKEYNDNVKIYQSYINKYNSSDDEFYRMNQDNLFTLNPGLFSNYNGFTFFLSTVNENTIKYFENLGYSTMVVTHFHDIYTSYISDSLLGLKYYFSSTGCNHAEEIDSFNFSTMSGKFYKFYNNKISVCENQNNLSLGYLVNTNINNYSMSLSDELTYFNISEYMLNSMLNENKYYFNKYENLEKIEPSKFELYTDDSEYIYIVVSDAYDSASILLNEKKYKLNEKTGRIAIFKNENKNTENNISANVILDGQTINDPKIKIYSEDTEGIVEALNKLKQNEMKIEKFSDTHIKGSIEVKDKDMGMLFLSIPYEDGWTLYVDGKETDIEILYDTFMGATLSEGEHEIELVYHVPGLKIGAIISGISLALTITYLYFERKKRKESQIMLEN